MKPVDIRLLRYASAARGFLLLSGVIGVLQTAVTIAFAWMLTDAVTGALAGRDVTASLLWLLGLAALRGVLIAASDAAGTRAAAKTGMQLRAALIGECALWRQSTRQRAIALKRPCIESPRAPSQ